MCEAHLQVFYVYLKQEIGELLMGWKLDPVLVH